MSDTATTTPAAPLPGIDSGATPPPASGGASATPGAATPSAAPGTTAGAGDAVGIDSSPKRRRSRPTKPAADAAPKLGRPNKKAQRTDRLGVALTSLALPVGLFVNQADGEAIVANAPNIAAAFAQLAEENPTVARLIDGATTSSAWVGVAIAIAPLVLAIAANHGMLPEGLGLLVGAPAPSVPSASAPDAAAA